LSVCISTKISAEFELGGPGHSPRRCVRLRRSEKQHRLSSFLICSHGLRRRLLVASFPTTWWV